MTTATDATGGDGGGTGAAIGHLVAIGLGYSAREIVARLGPRIRRLTATTRTPAGVARIGDAGGTAVVFDGSAASPELAAALRAATHILVSAPAETGGDPVLAHHAADVAAAPGLVWIGYLSTVGVYGDHAGGWVDEETPPAPSHARGARRVAAEAAWLAAGRPEAATAVLRLAGIYGPGRNVFVNLAEGTARRIVKPGQVFNRVHRDDIAAATIAALDRRVHGIVNLCDDEAAPPQDVVAYAAMLMGVEPPPEIDYATAELPPMARSFYADCRRVSNAKMRSVLGVRPAYPSYREGLGDLWRSGRWRG